MKKILWFSRHELTKAQLNDLSRIYGDFEYEQISKTIKSAYELKAEIDSSDVIAIVAPINLQSQFLKIAGDKPVILSKTKRIFKDNKKVEFVFDGWTKLVKIEIVTKDL